MAFLLVVISILRTFFVVVLLSILIYSILVTFIQYKFFYYLRFKEIFKAKDIIINISFCLIELQRLLAKSGIPNLKTGLQELPEVLQHVNRVIEIKSKNSNWLYILSRDKRGFDAFSIDKSNIPILKKTHDSSLCNFYEYKCRTPSTLNQSKLNKMVESYLQPSVGRLNKDGYRPEKIDILEISTVVKKHSDIFTKTLSFTKNSAHSDLSELFEYFKRHPNHSGLSNDTVPSKLCMDRVLQFLDYQAQDMKELYEIEKYCIENVHSPF